LKSIPKTALPEKISLLSTQAIDLPKSLNSLGFLSIILAGIAFAQLKSNSYILKEIYFTS
jgi:hypothetical protein